MIFDSVDNMRLYEKSIPGLSTAIKILNTENLLNKPAGEYSTDDPNCRYIINEYST